MKTKFFALLAITSIAFTQCKDEIAEPQHPAKIAKVSASKIGTDPSNPNNPMDEYGRIQGEAFVYANSQQAVYDANLSPAQAKEKWMADYKAYGAQHQPSMTLQQPVGPLNVQEANIINNVENVMRIHDTKVLIQAMNAIENNIVASRHIRTENKPYLLAMVSELKHSHVAIMEHNILLNGDFPTAGPKDWCDRWNDCMIKKIKGTGLIGSFLTMASPTAFVWIGDCIIDASGWW
jgi:hypothetical protein